MPKSLIRALREQEIKKFQKPRSNMIIELRERSMVRVGFPRVNLITLLGEDIED